MDLTELTDEQLTEHHSLVLQEQERRNNLATIPAQISDLRQKFIEGGGNLNLLEP